MDLKPVNLLLVVAGAVVLGGGLVVVGLQFGRSQATPASPPAANPPSSALQESVAPAPTAVAQEPTPVVVPRSSSISAPPPGVGALAGGGVSVAAAAAAAPSGNSGPSAGMLPFVPAAPNGEKGIAGEEQPTTRRDAGGGLPASGVSPYHNVHVLSVGVNIELPGVGRMLQYAARDAEEVGRVFQERYGFGNVVVLRNEQATRDRILRTLADMQARMARATGQDDFIFFFSGHGFTKRGTTMVNGRTQEANFGFLVPYEPRLSGAASVDEWRQRSLEMKELAEHITALPARHRLMFLDSCFSGLAIAGYAKTELPAQEAYREVMQHPTVQLFTAGKDTEVALENPELRHGVFTDALLAQIRNSGVRTSEEVYFSLCGTVRDSLGRLHASTPMTPQLRYLRSSEGTFIFVPTEWVGQWADQRPSDPAFLAAGQKGYFQPLDQERELREINTAAGSGQNLQNDHAWRERFQRYEARASMGDPFAMAAVSKMYETGVGTEKNPARAGMWGEEGREIFSYSAALGITDPNVSKFIDGFLNNDERMADLVGEENVEKTRQDIQKGLELFAKLREFFGGDGGKATVENIEKQRLSIIRDLQDNGRNRSARDRLNKVEDKFRELAAAYGDDAKPREFDQVAGLLTRARNSIELGVQAPAIRALEDIGQLLESIKAQAPDPAETSK